MRTAIFGLALAAGLAGAAQAGEFVVVSSTDPAIPAGRELDAGATVPLAPGRTLVVIHASGAVTRLNGAPGGVVVPMARMASSDSQRLEVLKLLVAQPRVRRSALIARSGPCPALEDLKELEAIVQAAGMAGCVTTAREAFTAFVERALGEPAPPKV